MRTRSVQVEILRACVNDDAAGAGAAAHRAPLDGLADLSIEHGVVGSVYRYLDALDGLSPDDRHELGARALQNRVRHAQIGRDLRYLAEVLAPLGAPWLVVKGPAVAATLYDPPEQRSAGDIDALVAPEHFAEAVELLERAGHPVHDANWPLVRQMTAGQLHMLLPEGTVLDLHWHLLYEHAERRRYPLTTGELLERRRPVRVAGTDIFTLDPVDTTVHLCFHAANEGADRLNWLSDITRSARALHGPEWDEVVTRTRAWQMQLPVGTVLQRAAYQLGAPIPVEVTSRLLPAGWRKMMAGIDRMFPVARTPRRVGNPASLFARSSAVAGTPGRATAAAASGIARRALHLARTGTAGRVDLSNREDSPASLLYPAEYRDADRAAYFAAVGEEA